MSLIPLMSVSILLASVVSTLMLQLPQSASSQLDEITLPSNSATALISSTSPSNSSTSNNRVSCESKYGSLLNLPSCVEALYFLMNSPKKLSFAQRGHGQPDVPLPRRILSCESSNSSGFKDSKTARGPI